MNFRSSLLVFFVVMGSLTACSSKNNGNQDTVENPSVEETAATSSESAPADLSKSPEDEIVLDAEGEDLFKEEGTSKSGTTLASTSDSSAASSPISEGSAPAITSETTDVGNEIFADNSAGALAETSTIESAPNTASGTENYKVKKHETLMLIAFKLYGDYRKWKELSSWNSDVLRGSHQLRRGMVLKYYPPSSPFNWGPKGNPYLIKNGDSLSKISGRVYNDIGKWKLIYENNKPMIKTPNLIFAGFTLYYIPKDELVAFGL